METGSSVLLSHSHALILLFSFILQLKREITRLCHGANYLTCFRALEPKDLWVLCDHGKQEALGTLLHTWNHSGLKMREGSRAAALSEDVEMQRCCNRKSNVIYSSAHALTSTFLDALAYSLWCWPFKCQSTEGFLFLAKADFEGN